MSTFAIENPSTGKKEQEFNRIDDTERDDILDRSMQAFASWKDTDISERAAILARTADLYEERADELADHIGREMGKLTRWAKAEVQIVADIYRWYAEHAHELLADEYLPAQGADKTVVRKEPLGPLLGIMPWNFPYYQVARFAAPNLLLGNTIVLKHASICPLSSQACQDLLEEAGLPQDAFINIYASGSQMDAFVADKRIKGVSLTGSETAGAAVAKTAGENYKKSVLELGGNDPFLVIDDDNLEWVLDQFTLIRMYNTGQACNAPKRLIVLEDFYDRSVDYLEKKIGAMQVGTYEDDKADLGPLSSIGARDEIVERLDKAAQEGTATIRVGGKKLDRDGAYMEATLLSDVDPTADVGCNEIFGPVAIIYKAKDVEEAIEIANNSDYGLSSSVWGTDLDAAFAVAQRLNDGMTFVNEHSVTGAGLPFGGVNRSGYGRELARWGVGEFVNEHLYRVSGQQDAGLSPAL
ncbi:NAD-dependent succinate-semialdehyde dehydrogenase [Corynebacterium flavescens]|uniref:Succinate-semialdehyde dehydrogenase n=1 Tax=Corynebacterium flavescens TaxID=28028 RepID=A0A1L7CJ28_CORFL|nr:NAD-dependent succinate-semialdehyde dehydrogenase [Corynebacterium flavescens]APT85857.1 succinate-semialdehyde dehydrogenase [Corynebacterium flavescens]KAA8724787.1 NAD-dependent succinate-semialdehyde dehydrogenase [Corynebacterium flavescens]MDN6100482.1 NAD-dependent succinate-semialdehyde dehydrogenase [Corynebacterium flavescens]MDN6200540.1 NAD-dependent succinate-semialdehyde dehydrogenase [Corynebacterium flavescens]MDN6227440.1 NAD-dependent succinate-semialdehyde dehydrogenase 